MARNKHSSSQHKKIKFRNYSGGTYTIELSKNLLSYNYTHLLYFLIAYFEYNIIAFIIADISMMEKKPIIAAIFMGLNAIGWHMQVKILRRFVREILQNAQKVLEIFISLFLVSCEIMLSLVLLNQNGDIASYILGAIILNFVLVSIILVFNHTIRKFA